jgi:predicted DNA-binding protein (UPF0251 family)/DNA-directed RNA polymerase subunit RPC12/RpoP
MSRPARYRKIEYPPLIKGFNPIGVHANRKEEINLFLEEYEAIRLMDYEHLNQVEAAKRMDVSRPTLTRIYDSARKKLAMALVNSLRVLVSGGRVEFNDDWFRCLDCDAVFQVINLDDRQLCPHCQSENLLHVNDEIRNQGHRGHNYHRRNMHQNQSGFCVCPECGNKVSHKPGKPCREMICTSCEVNMIREGSNC